MVIAACEGFLDKERERNYITRLQTFYIVGALGAKIKRPEELWKIDGDKDDNVVKRVWGSAEEANEMRRKINEANEKFKKQTQ